MIFPTDNQWGIPELPIAADSRGIVDPVVAWGSVGRDRKMLGTWHFYVGDYRFGKLMQEPDRLTGTQCTAACEPNVSVFEQSARWEAMAAIGRKRACAALWASYGIKILVDLCVPEAFRDLALLGVPRGWTTYSTRGFADRPDELVAEWELARDHSGGSPILMVVGGGETIARLCLDLPGAVQVFKNGTTLGRNQHDACGERHLHSEAMRNG